MPALVCGKGILANTPRTADLDASEFSGAKHLNHNTRRYPQMASDFGRCQQPGGEKLGRCLRHAFTLRIPFVDKAECPLHGRIVDEIQQ